MTEIGPASVGPNDRVDSRLPELIVVFGPKTRLAEAILTRKEVREVPALLIARSAADVDLLTARYTYAKIATRGEITESLLAASQVTVFCCALGPIHVADSGFDEEAGNPFPDLIALGKVLKYCGETRVSVVLISSVLALCVTPSRAAYAGWKNYVEGSLTRMLASHSDARLHILFPGRLIRRKSFTTLSGVCYTEYGEAAALAIRISRRAGRTRRVVGLDARLWLVWTRCTAMIAALARRV